MLFLPRMAKQKNKKKTDKTSDVYLLCSFIVVCKLQLVLSKVTVAAGPSPRVQSFAVAAGPSPRVQSFTVAAGPSPRVQSFTKVAMEGTKTKVRFDKYG
jgi:hypothetical protein